MSHIADGDLVAFVATIDFNRARAFYGDVLGLPLVDENPFALVYQAQNARLRVTQVDAVVAAPYTVLGWFVPDIMAALHELENHGVRFERVEGIGQDEFAVWPSPSGAKVAWFKDPDGNMLSVTQP